MGAVGMPSQPWPSLEAWHTPVSPTPGQTELAPLCVYCKPPDTCPIHTGKSAKASLLTSASFFQLSEMLSTYKTFLQANVLEFM